MSAARLPRDLHPVAWWLWALGLALAASFTTNPLVLLMLIGVAATTVALRRSEQPWGRSFRLYLWLGVAIVVIRVGFRLVFGGYFGGRVLLDLPAVPLPDWVAGITLFGPLYAQALVFALYDGLRLATIVICVGAANSLANPKRLLRSVPPALYEIGTALVVAVTVLPQFAESLRRVRAAQTLRAGETGRVAKLRRLLVPVLEDALERSLALAAGMDTRGYGRAGAATPAQRRTTGALMLAGLVGICVGVYAVLDRTAPRLLALPMLALGVAAAVAGLRSAGRRVLPDVPDRVGAVAGRHAHDAGAVEQHVAVQGAAGEARDQPGDDAEQGRLPDPGGPGHQHQLALLDDEVDVLQHRRRTVVGEADAAQLDHAATS